MVEVLGFLSRQVKIGRMLLTAGLAEFSCSGGPYRRNSLRDQCLKIAGLGVFGRVHPCFLSDRLVSEGAFQSSAGY
jgi:hypothetical protein